MKEYRDLIDAADYPGNQRILRISELPENCSRASIKSFFQSKLHPVRIS